MGGKPSALARTLHLDDANLVPDQIEEPSMLRVLKASDFVPIRPVAGEQLVEVRLRLSTLRALVQAPLLRELN
jgi:hypothetical protein